MSTFHQRGGGTQEMAALQPMEKPTDYPEPKNFGTLPAHGFYLRHVKNIDFSNVEIACDKPDARPAFWMQDVQGADLFRVKTNNAQSSVFRLQQVKDFRVFGSRAIKDRSEDSVESVDF